MNGFGPHAKRSLPGNDHFLCNQEPFITEYYAVPEQPDSINSNIINRGSQLEQVFVYLPTIRSIVGAYMLCVTAAHQGFVIPECCYLGMVADMRAVII